MFSRDANVPATRTEVRWTTMGFSYMCAYTYHADCWLKDCTCGCHRQERGRTNGERTNRETTQEEAEEGKKIPQGWKEGLIKWIRGRLGT